MEKLNRIKEALMDKGHSQAWLAGQLGVSKSAINDLCANRTQPSLRRLFDIARILKVAPGMLIEPTAGEVQTTKTTGEDEMGRCLHTIDEMVKRIRGLMNAPSNEP